MVLGALVAETGVVYDAEVAVDQGPVAPGVIQSRGTVAGVLRGSRIPQMVMGKSPKWHSFVPPDQTFLRGSGGRKERGHWRRRVIASGNAKGDQRPARGSGNGAG